MRVANRICCLTISILLSTGAVAAGQKDSQPDITFTSRTQLVSVPVVVSDKSGNHVPGLTKDDFEVKQDGKAKTIASFEEIKSTTNRPSHPAEAPGIFTNELSSDASPKRLTIFALDLVNTSFMDQAYARQQLIKFLANRVSTQEPIALIAIRSSGVKVLHDFTSDPALLVAALKQLSGEIPLVHDVGLSADAENLNAFANGTGEYVAMVQSEAILITLECFQHVAEAFSGVPGRKSLIWATAGFPFALDPATGSVLSAHSVNVNLNQQPGSAAAGSGGRLPTLPSATAIRGGGELQAIEPVYRRTLQMLSDASISVYPVDARGLIVYFPGAKESLNGAASARAYSEYKQALTESEQATMNDFAQITGGRAFYNRNDLDVAFQKSADDSASYYLLTYYLDKDTKPGWHKLRVKTKNGGADVRAREGFFVVSDSEKEQASKMDLKMALATPLDYTGIPLSVRFAGASTSNPVPPKKSVHFQITLPPQAGVIDTANDNLVDLDVVAMAQNSAGARADQFAQKVQTHLNAANLSLVQQSGLNYGNDLQLAPGSYYVRFVVRNNLDGRLGTVTAPLQVTP